MTIVRRNDGKLQVRRAQPNKLTHEAEQAFLAALSATCNIRLSAAAVGAAEAAFFRRRRQNPAFAREMRMALSQGYDQLELALCESRMPGAHEHDDWRHNEPPAIPPMTVNQALQLLYLHQKEARLLAEPDYLRKRRGESDAAHCFRLAAMWEERARREREAFAVAEAERRERGEPAWGPAGAAVRRELDARGPSTSYAGSPPLHLQGRISLPDLAQVTGWSKADPKKVPHHPDRALFGWWRIEDMEKKLRG